MLEAMYQASAWLVRATDDFADSQVLLKEARNVKYSGFVQPGQTLRIRADIIKREDKTTKLKASGQVDNTTVVSARLVLEQRNFSDNDPDRDAVDVLLKKKHKRELSTLYPDFRG